MNAAPAPTPSAPLPPAPPGGGTSFSVTVPAPTIPGSPLPLPALPGRSCLLLPPPVETAWPRSARWTAALLLVLAAALLVGHSLATLRWGTRPTELERDLGYRIDLNQADRAELRQLPGVGNSLADKILNDRLQHGRFRKVEDLLRVSGVGPATLEQLRPWICVGIDEPDEEGAPAPVAAEPMPLPKKLAPVPVRKARGRPAVSKKAARLKGPINVNTATAAELQQLPRIGPKLAQRIIAEREKGPFKSADDLQRVRGIKEKTVASLRPYVTVGR